MSFKAAYANFNINGVHLIKILLSANALHMALLQLEELTQLQFLQALRLFLSKS
jgi:hypothetical protein